MKSEQTTHLLLGIIATGVAAMAAIAFERRYHRQLRHLAHEADDVLDHAYERISHQTQQLGRAARHEAASLHDRIEDGVGTFKEKASALKERVSDGLETAGSQLRGGAEKLGDRLKEGADAVKAGAENAAEKARQAFAPPRD